MNVFSFDHANSVSSSLTQSKNSFRVNRFKVITVISIFRFSLFLLEQEWSGGWRVPICDVNQTWCCQVRSTYTSEQPKPLRHQHQRLCLQIQLVFDPGKEGQMLEGIARSRDCMNCGVEGKWPLSLLVHPEQLPAGLLCNLCTRIILFLCNSSFSFNNCS